MKPFWRNFLGIQVYTMCCTCIYSVIQVIVQIHALFFLRFVKKVFLRTDSLAFNIRREIEVIVFLRV